MNVTEVVISQLAFFSWREGQRLSPGCKPAMLGIAHVIRNRVESGWLDGDWLKIIAESPIHSSSLIDEMDWRSHVDIWDATFRWLYGQCSAVYDGSLKDAITIAADVRTVGGKGMPQKGLFYANIQQAIRPWFIRNILEQREQHPITADAGTIKFFA